MATSRRKSDQPPGVKSNGKFGEPWSYHTARPQDFKHTPFPFVCPEEWDADRRAKYTRERSHVNTEIWCRPDNGIGAGSITAFTPIRPPEEGGMIADRICCCVNEFAGVADPEGVIDTLRKLLADLESGRCKPDSRRVQLARAMIAKRRSKEEPSQT